MIVIFFSNIPFLFFPPLDQFEDYLNSTLFVQTFVGTPQKAGYEEGWSTEAKLRWPESICFDSKGYLYFTDGANGVIRVVSPDGHCSLLCGHPVKRGSSDGKKRTKLFFNSLIHSFFHYLKNRNWIRGIVEMANWIGIEQE